MASKLGAHDLRVKAQLGRSMLVGANKMAASLANQSPAFVPEDPSDQTCKRLLKTGLLSYCEPNYRVQINALPDDPHFTSLWGLDSSHGMDVVRAWDTSTGSAGIVVAVIDTGVDYTHSDLAGNMWTNPAEIPGNGIDDDANGYVDDIHGINANAANGDPMDDNGHGTHVAGTIGASGNNSIGISGVNWKLSIMGLKFLNASGSGSVADAIRAINYMLLMKARGVNVKVSNNSWGGPGYSQALKDAISQANAAGIIFAAAAGNESNNNDVSPSYPAGYDLPNVVSVAAVDQNQNLAWFSNYGAASVDIAAPGVGILSTVPGNSYASYSGTSMATPHVSGALALLFSVEPELAYQSAIQRLYDSATDLGSLSGVVRTGRAANAARLLGGQSVPLPQPTPEPAGCSYTVTAASASPDTRADSGDLLMTAADEYNYQEVVLPFSFPFDGAAFSRVAVSPNGVLYIGNSEPAGMDYQNNSAAPLSSIAALHTDLVSDVRVALDANSATFYWLGHLYSNPAAGTVHVRLTLSAEGSIAQWLSFSGPEIESLVAQQATVGVTGRALSRSSTYAFNSSAIVSGLALQYLPLCAGQSAPEEVRVMDLSLRGIEYDGNKRRLVRNVAPGGIFRLDVLASPDGAAARAMQVNFFLDGQLCPDNRQMEIGGGFSSMRGRMPRGLGRGYKRFTVTVQDVSISRRIASSRRTRARRVASKEFGLICRNLASSLAKR